jgi:hypothetical protein
MAGVRYGQRRGGSSSEEGRVPNHARTSACNSSRRIPTVALALALVGWAPTDYEIPVTPDPVDCQVPPLTLSALAALHELTTPGADPTIEALLQDVAAAGLPDGSPVDAATLAEVAAVVRTNVACVNAADLPRLLALRTDAEAQRVLLAEGPLALPQDPALAPNPGTDPASWSSLLAVRGARLLPDGRVGAIVVIRHPRPEGTAITLSFFSFVQSGGHWLIDGAELIDAVAPGA